MLLLCPRYTRCSRSLKQIIPVFISNQELTLDGLLIRKTVFYDEARTICGTLLIHELAHGLLEHADYARDVQLLNMERQAWEKALEIAQSYGETIDEDVIETHLDTYRDWLHQRSTCPVCQAVGLQIKKQAYTCPACSHEWRVNEAQNLCPSEIFTK